MINNRQEIADAYESGTTLRDYKGSVTSSGKEALPNIHKQILSGFAKDIPRTLTVSKEVCCKGITLQNNQLSKYCNRDYFINLNSTFRLNKHFMILMALVTFYLRNGLFFLRLKNMIRFVMKMKAM